MEPVRPITIFPVGHPDPRVAQAGFDLDHAYLERCWAPLLGPTATALLRRLPVLWDEVEPAQMAFAELSRSIGLGSGCGTHSPLQRTLDRLVSHRFARSSTEDGWEVFRQVRPLEVRELRRLPAWSRRMHTQLLDEHVARLAGATPATQLTARLDRLQSRRSPDHSHTVEAPAHHLAR